MGNFSPKHSFRPWLKTDMTWHESDVMWGWQQDIGTNFLLGLLQAWHRYVVLKKITKVLFWPPHFDTSYLSRVIWLYINYNKWQLSLDLSWQPTSPSDSPYLCPSQCWGYRYMAVPDILRGCCGFKPRFTCLCSLPSYPLRQLSIPGRYLAQHVPFCLQLCGWPFTISWSWSRDSFQFSVWYESNDSLCLIFTSFWENIA